jgi:hypothetical protein
METTVVRVVYSIYALWLSVADLENYSDHIWILRYRRERDEALRAHKRQLFRRKILSRVGLARPIERDEYERKIVVDKRKEREQEEKKGWVKPRRRSPPKDKAQRR